MTEETTERHSTGSGSHAEFLRQMKPLAERSRQARECELQLEALVGASDATRESIMHNLDLQHSARLARLQFSD